MDTEDGPIVRLGSSTRGWIDDPDIALNTQFSFCISSEQFPFVNAFNTDVDTQHVFASGVAMIRL